MWRACVGYKECVGGSLSCRVGELKQQGVAVGTFAQGQQDAADVGDVVDEHGVGVGRTYAKYVGQLQLLMGFTCIKVALHHDHIVERTVDVGTTAGKERDNEYCQY